MCHGDADADGARCKPPLVSLLTVRAAAATAAPVPPLVSRFLPASRWSQQPCQQRRRLGSGDGDLIVGGSSGTPLKPQFSHASQATAARGWFRKRNAIACPSFAGGAPPGGMAVTQEIIEMLDEVGGGCVRGGTEVLPDPAVTVVAGTSRRPRSSKDWGGGSSAIG